MDITLTPNQFSDALQKVSNMDYTKSLLKSAIAIENEAKQNCPVGTGELRNSITHNMVGPNEVEVGTNLFYAPYVEYGTGIWAAAGDGRQTPWSYQDAEGNWHTTIGQKPQPFLMPAFEANRDEIIDNIKNQIIEAFTNGGL